MVMVVWSSADDDSDVVVRRYARYVIDNDVFDCYDVPILRLMHWIIVLWADGAAWEEALSINLMLILIC